MDDQELLNTGRFYNFSERLINNDYSYEKDILLLVGLYESFLNEAATIGANASSDSILHGQNGFIAQELAFEEIKNFVAHNINTY